MRRLIYLPITALAAACTEPLPTTATATSLTVPARAPTATVPLVPLELRTQADYDALEDRWTSRRSSDSLVAALRALAEAQPKPDILLLQRIAVLVADDIGTNRPALDAALEAGTRLRDAAPEDPHTLWFNGWVLWQFLTLGGSLNVEGAGQKDLVTAALRQWKDLLARAPDYVGPRKLGAVMVKGAVARMEAALAEAERPAEAAPAGSMHVATPSEMEAIGVQARFDAAPEGGRRGICRDWREREPSAEPSAAELRMDLSCGILANDIAQAVAAIGRLRASDGAAFDPCAALARLAERVEKAALDQALAALTPPLVCR